MTRTESNRTTSNQVTVERVIPAPAEEIFELLAHPERHSEFDGSGTVRTSRRSGRRVGLGVWFGMNMKWGVPYATRNVVREFEENRRITWQTLAPAPLDKLFTGRQWRYELEPVDGGSSCGRRGTSAPRSRSRGPSSGSGSAG